MTDTTGQTGRASFRNYKKEIRALLSKRDFSFFETNIENNTFRALNSLIFDKDNLIIWRAIEAIGINSAAIFEKDPKRVREYLRRFFWSMNDESGTICWYAPEAIGEILFKNPALIKEYGGMLLSFVIEEPFEAGIRLAMARLAEHEKEMFWTVIDLIRKTLRHPDDRIRGASVIMMKELGYKIDQEDIERLSKDEARFELYNYDLGDLELKAIKDLL